jgi:hypothetical protein
MIPTNAHIIDLLRQLEIMIAAHTHLSVDDALVVARDGLLFLLTDDSDFTRLLVCDFAAWALETEQWAEVAV